MSVDQLLDEVGKLTDTERQILFLKLGVCDNSINLEESPEFIAFVEEGIRSAEEGPMIPIEEVMEEMKTWDTKSP
jgi:predicted transcriptional regulator